MELEKLHSAYALRRELAKVSAKSSAKANRATVNSVATTPIEDAAKVEISGNVFRNELTKHIKDYNEGKGYLSKETSLRLDEKGSKTADTLSQEDPKASSLYAGYLTANLSYGSKARFIDNISNTLSASNNIRKAYKPQQ